jgi:hypothetical protein
MNTDEVQNQQMTNHWQRVAIGNTADDRRSR